MKSDILLFAVDLFLKSTGVVLFTWLVLLFWKRSSAAQRGCAWGMVFAVLALLPFTRLVAPHWSISLPQPAKFETVSVKLALTHAAPSSTGDFAVVSPSTETRPVLDAATILVGGWSIGIALTLAYRFAGMFLLRRCYRASSPWQEKETETLARHLVVDCGIARSISFRWSKSCQVPVTWGTWRPVVMLPDEAQHWPQERLTSVLRHELGHVKNFDHLKRWLAFLVCAFYWPNPLVWLAAKHFHLAQEEESDNLVLGAGVSRQDYAAQLMEVIRATAGQPTWALPSVAMARHSTLEGRFLAILDESRNRQNSSWQLMAGGIGLAVILGMVSGAVQLRAEVPPPQDSRSYASAADQAAYNQTLNAVLPKIDLQQAGLGDLINALNEASQKANPVGLPVRFVVGGPSTIKVDLKFEGGTLNDAIALIAKQTKFQYKLSPLYAYYMDDGDAVLHAHISKVLCNFWPVDTSETMWSRMISISDGGMRLLQLQPDASGDVQKDLEKWGIQFPTGTIATCSPDKTHPGTNILTVKNTGDQVAQIFNMIMALSAESVHAAPKPPAGH